MNSGTELECLIEQAGKKLASDKHFNLLQKFVNYEQKGFITLSPGPNVIKEFLSVIYELLK
jgi:hypothetical protein